MRTSRWLSFGSIVLGIGIAVNSLLGPLFGHTIRYHVTTMMVNQTIGLDLVMVVVVAPLSVVAGILALREHPAGPVLALGPAISSAYMFPQYVVGPEYLRLPGKNALFFPLHLGLFILGWLIAVAAWRAMNTERLALMSERMTRTAPWLLGIATFLVFSRYVPALLDATSQRPTSQDYVQGVTFFWVIALLDLGVALPVTVATIVGLRRGAGWARQAIYSVVGWFGLVGLSVAGMAIAMYANHDPASSLGKAAMFTVMGVGLAALAAVFYRPLFERPDAAGESNREVPELDRDDKVSAAG
jgi:FtsH-binding integral membrane protein